MLRNESAVDMIAARMPAKASPASTGGANWSRKSGAASSARTSGGQPPRATSAGTARPIPSQISTQSAWLPPSTSGIHLSFARVVEHVELVQHVRLAQHADAEDEEEAERGEGRNPAERLEKRRAERRRHRRCAPLIPLQPPVASRAKTKTATAVTSISTPCTRSV